MRDLRFEAMCAHPAGKGIPESAEVVQARMDAEAVTLANSGRRARGVWVVAAGQVAGIVGLFVVVCGFAFLGDPVGGLPL